MSERYTFFKTQPGPVAKNATARPPAGDWTRDPGSLDQRSTDWATEAVAVSLGASSVNIHIYTHTPTHARARHRHTDTQTHRHTYTHTHIHTNKQTKLQKTWFSLWRRANARNVRPYYPYWQYTDLFIFRYIYIYIHTHTYTHTKTYKRIVCSLGSVDWPNTFENFTRLVYCWNTHKRDVTFRASVV